MAALKLEVILNEALDEISTQMINNASEVGRHKGPGPAPLAQCVERWTSTPEARVQIRVAAIQRFTSRADTVQANSAFHP